MSEPWAPTYDQLSPDAATMVRGLATLRLEAATMVSVSAVLATPPELLRPTVAEVERLGWLAPDGPDSWVVPSAARFCLVTLAERIGQAESAALATRIAQHHLHHPPALINTQADERRGGEVVAAIDCATRHQRPDLAVALARATWSRVRARSASRWWTDLARAGETAARTAGADADLAWLLLESGSRFAAAGRRAEAQRQWTTALQHAAEHHDHDRFDEMLLRLARHYVDDGRLHRAMDMLFELVKHRQDHGDAIEVADALMRLGETMLLANRAGTAVEYLTEADEVLTGVDPATGDVVRRHASALVALGTAQESTQPAAARRTYSRALAMLVDRDETAAEQVRQLLSAASRSPGLTRTSSPALRPAE